MTSSFNPDSIDLSTEQALDYEQQYSAHNYHPLPVVFSRARGAHVWDPEVLFFNNVVSLICGLLTFYFRENIILIFFRLILL